MSERSAARRARQLAKTVFGFSRLREGQQEAVQAVFAGHDTLAVMPTGAGKSAIYQIAGLALAGPTLVVSPLIALQRDQVQALRDLGAGPASALNSTLSAAEREETLRAYGAGQLKFLLLSPEQLTNEAVLDRLRTNRPALLTVDEAHCVSEWGFDFRPEYLKLGEAARALGRPTILALTATAAPPVRAEILARLGMHTSGGRAARMVVRGFDRPNLDLAAQQFENAGERRRALLDYTLTAPKPGLIYAATRKKAEGLSLELNAQGLTVAAYHAGLRPKARETVQRAWMAGELEVVVATTAFGMGIDKPDVRFVAHADLPGSPDAYYQEIGRAGRDFDPAEARLFFQRADTRLRRFFAGGTPVSLEDLMQLLRLLAVANRAVQAGDLRETSGLTETRFTAALAHLEEVKAARTLRGGRVKLRSQLDVSDVERVAREAAVVQERRHEYERSRVEMMLGYATTGGCRREYLLGYFGEAYTPPCGRCDNCRAGKVAAPTQGAPFAVGEAVRHASLGDGQVVHLEEGKITVLFKGHGYQTLSLDIVLGSGLLESTTPR